MIQYLKQYESELIDKELVRQNQVPYMVGWVRKYLAFSRPEEMLCSLILLRGRGGRNGRYGRLWMR